MQLCCNDALYIEWEGTLWFAALCRKRLGLLAGFISLPSGINNRFLRIFVFTYILGGWFKKDSVKTPALFWDFKSIWWNYINPIISTNPSVQIWNLTYALHWYFQYQSLYPGFLQLHNAISICDSEKKCSRALFWIWYWNNSHLTYNYYFRFNFSLW